MSFETLLYEKQDGVATLTLNRPERHNAFNVAMARELREVWESADETSKSADSRVVMSRMTAQRSRPADARVSWSGLTARRNR